MHAVSGWGHNASSMQCCPCQTWVRERRRRSGEHGVDGAELAARLPSWRKVGEPAGPVVWNVLGTCLLRARRERACSALLQNACQRFAAELKNRGRDSPGRRPGAGTANRHQLSGRSRSRDGHPLALLHPFVPVGVLGNVPEQVIPAKRLINRVVMGWWRCEA